MDPQAWIMDALSHILDGDLDLALEYHDTYIYWRERGGFEPETVFGPGDPVAWKIYQLALKLRKSV